MGKYMSINSNNHARISSSITAGYVVGLPPAFLFPLNVLPPATHAFLHRSALRGGSILQIFLTVDSLRAKALAVFR